MLFVCVCASSLRILYNIIYHIKFLPKLVPELLLSPPINNVSLLSLLTCPICASNIFLIVEPSNGSIVNLQGQHSWKKKKKHFTFPNSYQLPVTPHLQSNNRFSSRNHSLSIFSFLAPKWCQIFISSLESAFEFRQEVIGYSDVINAHVSVITMYWQVDIVALGIHKVVC